MNINKLFSYRLGLLSTCAALGVLSALAILPAAGNSASAAENTASISVNAKPTLSVSSASDVTMTITPSTTATFSSSSTTFGVKTNNPTGYAVYVNTKNNQSTLAHESSSTTINAIANADGVTSADFAANTWGFAIGNVAPSASTLYKPVPGTAGEPTVSTSTIATNDSYNLTFGAAVDTTIPSGNYSNTVVVSVIANPVPVLMSDISTMQEMTPSFCADVEEESTAQLTDTRDGKSYWVTKLKDGKCWMTQNLDLNIPASGLLAADTDIETDWNSSSAYPPQATVVTDTAPTSNPDSGDARYVATRSYDFGNIILKSPTTWTTCNSKTGVITTACPNTWQDVSGMTDNTLTDSQVAVSGDKYNAHYLMGNYYQYNTATAGTGAAVTASGANATGSICPKGWRLPTSTSSGEFQALMNAYGVTSSTVTAQMNATPLYFVQGGGLWFDSDGLYSGGYYGYYWSSTSYSSTDAYYLRFRSGYLSPSFSIHRYNGFSVRCVAR